MTTYTLRDGHGAVIESNLSVGECAEAMLTHDGHEYEVRHHKDGWRELYVSAYSRNASGGNGGMWATGLRADADLTDDDAWEKIAREVIESGRFLSAMTDADDKEACQELAEEGED